MASKPAAPDDTDEEGKHQREYREAVSRLGNLSPEQLLAMGQEALLRDLVALVQSGGASAAEKAVLRALLKDNGLTMGPPRQDAAPKPDSPDLPDLGDPDWLTNR